MGRGESLRLMAARSEVRHVIFLIQLVSCFIGPATAQQGVEGDL